MRADEGGVATPICKEKLCHFERREKSYNV
jgi:hypothetical protein